MAVINDLIAQIQDAELRNKIEQEVNRMNKQKKFGFVFEEHLPECTPLYEMPVNCGSNVVLKSGNINEIYRVIAIDKELSKMYALFAPIQAIYKESQSLKGLTKMKYDKE